MVSQKQDKERAMPGALEGTTVVSLEQAMAAPLATITVAPVLTSTFRRFGETH
jgi:hypothetical protein